MSERSDKTVSCSRRAFLSGAAAVGVAAAVRPIMGGAQAATSSRLLDVHHHFVTPHYIEVLGRSDLAGGGAGVTAPPGWGVNQSLEAMDRAGVATSMLSLNNPGVWLGDAEKTRTLCRHCNDYAAKAVQDHPGRFGHFASLPLPDVDGALKEIAYALDTLRADGFILHSNDADHWLGSQEYWPVYEELNRRHATVFIHPMTPGCCQHLPIATPPVILEYPFDTARAITNWVFSGSAARFPNIKLIFSHGGGAAPMLLSRLATIAVVKPELASFVPKGAQYELQKFYYDTAAVYNPTAFAALRTMLPRSQILFGTDIPYSKMETCAELLGQLVTDPADHRAIGRDNALTLFPRYA